MWKGEFEAPEFHKEGFHCPHCNTYARQVWGKICYGTYYSTVKLDVPTATNIIVGLEVSLCDRCHQNSIWMNKKLVYPSKISAPLAHKDMPEPVSEYYNEARQVSVFSPRSAAVLLRIAAKKLCEYHGESENTNLNRAICNLKKKGLPDQVTQSLDVLRIFGNEGGAHDGMIDLTGADNKEIVDRLFQFVNLIVEKTITEPRVVGDMFSAIPESKKKAIEERDAKK